MAPMFTMTGTPVRKCEATSLASEYVCGSSVMISDMSEERRGRGALALGFDVSGLALSELPKPK